MTILVVFVLSISIVFGVVGYKYDDLVNQPK